MRNVKLDRMINYGVEEIERVAPFNSMVELDVKEVARGHFFAFIKVKVNHKLYIARKEGKDMYEGFHKALKALKAQLAKNKVNHRVERKLKYKLEDNEKLAA
jgi:ribosome-associated translation inhibitor RaiA